jgi:hypothetical protein
MSTIQTMTTRGDLALIEHPIAQELLQATIPARLAYVALDGTPRVVPMLFHWTGEEIVVTAWTDDYKVAAIEARPEVALTIDTSEAPFRVLSIRATAEVTIVNGIAPECLPTFTRYFGPEGARAQIEQMSQMGAPMAHIALQPTWVDVIDFETRFPAGMTRRMKKFVVSSS